MFFMTRKRFEQEVNKRIEEWQRREDHERELRNVYTYFYKLEERVIRLERKAELNGAAVEVHNAKEL